MLYDFLLDTDPSEHRNIWVRGKNEIEAKYQAIIQGLLLPTRHIFVKDTREAYSTGFVYHFVNGDNPFGSEFSVTAYSYQQALSDAYKQNAPFNIVLTDIERISDNKSQNRNSVSKPFQTVDDVFNKLEKEIQKGYDERKYDTSRGLDEGLSESSYWDLVDEESNDGEMKLDQSDEEDILTSDTSNVTLNITVHSDNSVKFAEVLDVLNEIEKPLSSLGNVSLVVDHNRNN